MVLSQTKEGEFYNKIILVFHTTLVNLVKIGESTKEGIQMGKIRKTLKLSGSLDIPKKM